MAVVMHKKKWTIQNLSTSVTVKHYREFRGNKNRDAIANLIYEEFYERYLQPFKSNPAKHGFGMMACGCLMTEALYCYKKGRQQAGEAGGTAFNKAISAETQLAGSRPEPVGGAQSS
jgi:hypothetical protein